jgi:hypothetical protein
MLVTDGPQWKLSRSIIRPAFDIAHVVNLGRLRVHVEQFMQTSSLRCIDRRLVPTAQATGTHDCHEAQRITLTVIRPLISQASSSSAAL